ncbi:hypothetical protein BV20DRAFT_1125721 [Pilatotrama ljubarskyi]|nr:hypothetical protein BV20DRAFT_1125721 [Pilatotrama ljubarskyi]
MPFSRYLGDGQDTHDDHEAVDHNVTFSTNVQFQLPNLILNAPTVPPGGGAEALPAGFYPPSSSLAWFSAPDGYSNPFALQSASSSSYQQQPPLPSSSCSPHSAPSVSYSIPAYNHPLDPNARAYPSHLPISIPSALGLPVYSASGFDLLSILARVANRPFPKINLGPVDLSCSFVVTDTRRFDSPIVYASPTFYKLTGYDEHEVIGRNCRFLQAPGGLIQRGQERVHTAPDAVAHLRKNIIADKECQVSIINYRKDGSAFINMVSVIPIRGGVHDHPDEADDIVFHVGFQVDLSEQPKAILGKLKDGTYLVNYSDKTITSTTAPGPRDWRTSSMTLRGMSKELRALLADQAFIASFNLSFSTHASTAIALTASPSEPIHLDPYDGNKPIHMFLLDRSPDFLHVVSLKGAFLYAAPAVRSVLGYDPDELVGRSLADFCHPADCVPLMRELKEASATPGAGLIPASASTSSSSSAGMNPNADGSPNQPSSSGVTPRPVDLLFRIQAKGRGYVWIECRGRLHVEPGKGRKAIILCGRLRNLPHLEWGPISRAGGLVPPLYRPLPPPIGSSLDVDANADDRPPEREFWGMLSTNATFLCVGAAVRDVLGWGAGEVIGKPLAEFVSGSPPQDVRMAVEVEMTKILADAGGSDSAGLACDVHTKDRGAVPVHIVLYRSRPKVSQDDADSTGNGADPASQGPVVCQVKLCEGTAPPPTNPLVHGLEESVFEETQLDRESSWQYELQQLKFRNQRLIEEVLALEAAITKKIRRKQSLGVMSPGTSVGLGISSVGRSVSAATRMPIAYQHPASGMQPPYPSQVSQPLNVRFVSGNHVVPPAPPPALTAARSHAPPPPPQPQSMPLPSSSVLSSAPRMSPPPHPSVQAQRQMSPSVLQGPYAQAQSRAVYAPRIRRSFDSSLQGWSHYSFDQPEHVPGPATGLTNSAAGYSGMPMKRTWESALRDSGSGGGGGGGGGA